MTTTTMGAVVTWHVYGRRSHLVSLLFGHQTVSVYFSLAHVWLHLIYAKQMKCTHLNKKGPDICLADFGWIGRDILGSILLVWPEMHSSCWLRDRRRCVDGEVRWRWRVGREFTKTNANFAWLFYRWYAVMMEWWGRRTSQLINAVAGTCKCTVIVHTEASAQLLMSPPPLVECIFVVAHMCIYILVLCLCTPLSCQ